MIIENSEDHKMGNKVFSEKSAIYILIFGLILVLLSLIIFLIFGNWEFSLSLNEEKVAQYGDFIGGVAGSVFALVGVILFYIALKEQRIDFKTNQSAVRLQLKALNQQIEEFKAQRDELESTRKIYEQQTKTMKNQQFDSNFYSLLNVYMSIKKNLNSGSDLFVKLFENLEADIVFDTGEKLNDFHKKVVKKYENIFLTNRNQLSQYFKTIYRLLKMIDDCDHLTDDEKIFYSKILRSQITNAELLILYYNYHSSFGMKVQSLILKYDFLKHIETLSKVEFLKKFTIDIENKIQLILLTEKLKNLLNINILAAKDLENVDPINISEKYDGCDCILGITIDEALELKLYFPVATTTVFSLSNEQFKDFIYLFLNDELYYNKFENLSNAEIQKSILTNDDNLIFNFSISKF
jgi:hypothetical protein